MIKKILLIVVSFGIGAFICGWCVLVLSQRASTIWAAESALQMAFRFEQAAKTEFGKNNKTLAHDFMMSALFIRRDLSAENNRVAWPIDMPAIGLSAPSIGITNFTVVTDDAVRTKKILLSYECAVVVLSDAATQLDYLRNIQKAFPKMTSEACYAMGIALLKN